MSAPFFTVRCDGCGNEQIVFANPATTVTCHVCDDVLAEPAGGRGVFHGQVIDEVA